MTNKKHPQAHILRAIADGVPVQLRYNGETSWVTFDPDRHAFHTQNGVEWRIKPKPKVKKYKVVMFHKGDNELKVSNGYYKDQSEFEARVSSYTFVQLVEATMIEVEEE